MPFGLSGAPASFQRLMDKVCRGLPFATTYLDDVLVHSATVEEHKDHLRVLFQRLSSAGLTLRGKKCHIGMTKVTYLGHQFSAAGMEPDDQKVAAVQEWETPKNVSDLKSFLGLASYYRRYISNFADIAAPLHHLTEKGVPFVWDADCQSAFDLLKARLTQAPVLSYPEFSSSAASFQLQTDASAGGLGVVLEQNGHVIAYASRTLTQSERNYSVIQKECLALVYGMKQFRHYLLGRQFTVLTDHAPLQWLAGQKMEGLLARWALALQEYDFSIVYRKGCLNGNADALSRKVPIGGNHSAATACVPHLQKDLLQHQQADPVICQLQAALSNSPTRPVGPAWKRPPLNRYRQLWSQLTLKEGLVCRHYTPGPTMETVTVPIIPSALQSDLINQYHDAPGAAHLGPEKTAAKVRHVGYWVGMLQDIDQYCRKCSVCQASKIPSPMKVPLVNVPIGKPWEMIAVDILEVPVSYHNNRYLLVIQDYFTKWAEAVPLPDQTASRITDELVKVFTRYGLPDTLHSDQGRNFESTLLRQTLEAFGVSKSRTTAYHPQGDGLVERFNRSLLQMLRAYVREQADWERFLPLVLFAYRTAVHSSTGISPFQLMFGRQPQTPPLPQTTAHEPGSYHAHLCSKLAQLCDFVETHLTEAACHQKKSYDQHTRLRSFQVGDCVWLSVPTAGKLDPRWEGGWVIRSVLGPTTYTITDGKRSKTVHVNRLQRRNQTQANPGTVRQESTTTWQPTLIHHDIVSDDPAPEPRYPTRTRRPPDRLQL